MNIKSLVLSSALLVLAGCVSPSRYEPAEGRNTSGYSDQRLAENRYRVSFTGNSATRRETVENFLLLRAAEVTREAGYSWFVFDDRDTEAKTTYHTDFVGYPGWGPQWGRFGWYWRTWPYDPWDPYWGRSQVVRPSTRYEAYAEIVLLSPDAAKKDSHAMNASDVIARLGPASAPAN
jgi:hypothetical protein